MHLQHVIFATVEQYVYRGGSGWLGQYNYGVQSFQTVTVFFLVMVMVMVVPNGELGKFCDCVVTYVETTLVEAGFIKISDTWFYHGYMVIWFYVLVITPSPRSVAGI